MLFYIERGLKECIFSFLLYFQDNYILMWIITVYYIILKLALF